MPQILLTWIDNSTSESGFELQRSLTGTGDWATLFEPDVNATSYVDTAVAAGTTYYYRLRAKRGAERSEWTNIASAMIPAIVTLWWFETDQITGLVDGNAVTTWPDQSGNNLTMHFPGTNGGTKPTYKTNIFGALPAVRVAAGNQGDIPFPNFSPVLTGKSCTFYHVLDYDAQQTGAAVLLQSFLTGTAAAISLFASGDLLDLVNQQNNQVGYEVVRNAVPSTVDKDLVNATDGRQLLVFTFNLGTTTATLHWNGQLVSTHTIPTIPAGGFAFGQDFIEFFAANGGGNACVGDHGAAIAFALAHDDTTRQGWESYLIAKYGITDTTFVNAPTVLAAVANGASQIDLTWTDNADNEDGFSLERSLNGSTGWTVVQSPAANATSVSDTGLSSGTQYFYRLRAQTGPIPVYSTYSNTANATTSASFSLYALPNQLFMFESDSIPVQSDNTGLVHWPDGSPYNDRTNFDGVNAKYRTNHFGSLPAVQTLAGHGGTKEGTTFAIFPTTSLTEYFVLDYQVADQTDVISGGVLVADIAVGGNHSVTAVVGSDFNGTDKVSFIEDDTFTVHDFAADTNGKKLLTFVWNKATGTCKLYRNGTLVNTISGLGTGGWYMDNGSLYMFQVGGVGAFIGYVGAALGFGVAHDDTTRGNVESFLMTKYSVP